MLDKVDTVQERTYLDVLLTDTFVEAIPYMKEHNHVALWGTTIFFVLTLIFALYVINKRVHSFKEEERKEATIKDVLSLLLLGLSVVSLTFLYVY